MDNGAEDFDEKLKRIKAVPIPALLFTFREVLGNQSIRRAKAR